MIALWLLMAFAAGVGVTHGAWWWTAGRMMRDARRHLASLDEMLSGDEAPAPLTHYGAIMHEDAFGQHHRLQ